MKKVVIFFIVLLPGTLISFGQCDNTLTPAQNPSVAYRLRGNRCEGTYSAQVGAPSMDIAGFTIGPLSYKLERNEIIKIRNTRNSPISIRSSALLIGTYYRMDASLRSMDTLRWAINDVLLDLGIPSKYLGVYGFVGSEQAKTYIPVKPVSSISDSSNIKLYLIIRPATKVNNARYRYGLATQALGEYIMAESSNSRQTITIILPENLRGVYNIEIAASLEPGNTLVTRQYKLMIQ